MPAIPIADSRAPIVVGISATSSAISVAIETLGAAKSANGRRVTTTTRKTRVSPASRMPSAISFGVLRRAAPSTRAIIRSRKLFPGSWVISTTIRSESTRVPPVTALRSPPDSRITGADSPGDRRLVDRGDALDHGPVAGDHLAGLDDHDVAAAAARWPGPRGRRAAARPCRCASRAARRPGPCRGPRPAPRRGCRRSTVSQSQSATTPVNQAGSSPPPSGSPPKTWIEQADRRDDAPRPRPRTSPGCGSSRAGRACARLADERRAQDASASSRLTVLVHGASSSRAMLSSSTFTPGSPRNSERPAGRCSRRSARATRSSGIPRTAATRFAWIRAFASEICGSTPEAEVVTASTGTSAAVSPGS